MKIFVVMQSIWGYDVPHSAWSTLEKAKEKRASLEGWGEIIEMKVDSENKEEEQVNEF